MIPFLKNRDGSIEATFTAVEVRLVTTLETQLIELLAEVTTPGDDPLPGLVIGGSSAPSGDPALARLLPDAYADDADAAEFRRLTERGLATRKLANARFVRETAQEVVTLDAAGADRWMRSIGDLRLTIAARIGIENDDSIVDEDDDEAQAMLDVYDWLAGVQDSLVRMLV